MLFAATFFAAARFDANLLLAASVMALRPTVESFRFRFCCNVARGRDAFSLVGHRSFFRRTFKQGPHWVLCPMPPQCTDIRRFWLPEIRTGYTALLWIACGVTASMCLKLTIGTKFWV
jgi:hypothetical protein